MNLSHNGLTSIHMTEADAARLIDLLTHLLLQSQAAHAAESDSATSD